MSHGIPLRTYINNSATFIISIFLAVKADIQIGLSLTDWLIHSLTSTIGHNSVNFQARTQKFCMVVCHTKLNRTKAYQTKPNINTHIPCYRNLTKYNTYLVWKIFKTHKIMLQYLKNNNNYCISFLSSGREIILQIPNTLGIQ